MRQINVDETEYKCSICGEIYLVEDMFDSATCNGCIDLYSDTSKRDAYHENKTQRKKMPASPKVGIGAKTRQKQTEIEEILEDKKGKFVFKGFKKMYV